MIFNIPFKKKFNVLYKKFAWLPTRMTVNPNIVVWLQPYYRIWIKLYYVIYYRNLFPCSSTDSKPMTIDRRMFKISGTEGEYNI